MEYSAQSNNKKEITKIVLEEIKTKLHTYIKVNINFDTTTHKKLLNQRKLVCCILSFHMIITII